MSSKSEDLSSNPSAEKEKKQKTRKMVKDYLLFMISIFSPGVLCVDPL
jgi:hypothetical protein